MKTQERNLMATDDIFEDVSGTLVIGVLSVASIIIVLSSCLWCRQKWAKFKERRRQRLSGQFNTVVVPPAAAEFTIFPTQPNTHLTSISTVSAAILDEIVFEPLPEIRSRSLQAVAQNIRPARFTGLSGKISLQDWFDEHQINFPRNQLKYLREVGSAWYGQAVEGEAYNMIANEEKTQIVVKILRVDAAVLEYMQFLHEARPFRDLQHPHLLRLMGRCLEVHPFLLIMEHCDLDLKSYLIQQRKSPEFFLKDGLMLRMACNIASALQHMHEHGYIHCDVATHSCLITADLKVKVGDYGTALYMHKSDYYCLGDIAFPLRWCAPECLHCTDSIIEAKDITREANVWSLGVLLWELLEFGKLPYMDYTDDEVVQKVIIESSLKLEQPKTPCVHKDMIFKIMQLCWLPASHRPSLQKIITLLNYLYDNKDVVSESVAFESRWNSLQPVLRNHNLVQPNTAISSLRFESDFNLKSDQGLSRDCDSIMSSEFSPSQYGDKSPSRSSLSTGYEGGLLTEISPSLQNLRGSIENLTIASTSTNEEPDIEVLKPVANHNEDPDSMQKTITEAIRDLDIILAGEITSSDTSKCTTPEKNPGEIFQAPHPVVVTKFSNSVSLVNGGKSEGNLQEHTELREHAKRNGDVRNISPLDIASDSASCLNQEKREEVKTLPLMDGHNAELGFTSS